MKKLMTLLILLASSQMANASPYFGINFQKNDLNLKSKQKELSNITYSDDNYIESKFDNVGAFVGYSFKDIADIELGYFSKSEDKTATIPGFIYIDTGLPVQVQGKSKLTIVNLDGIKNFKVNDTFKVYGSIGAAKIDNDYTISLLRTDLTTKTSDSGFGAGAGLGIEAKLYHNLSARIGAKYTRTFGMDSVKDLMTYQIGLKYSL